MHVSHLNWCKQTCSTVFLNSLKKIHVVKFVHLNSNKSIKVFILLYTLKQNVFKSMYPFFYAFTIPLCLRFVVLLFQSKFMRFFQHSGFRFLFFVNTFLLLSCVYAFLFPFWFYTFLFKICVYVFLFKFVFMHYFHSVFVCCFFFLSGLILFMSLSFPVCVYAFIFHSVSVGFFYTMFYVSWDSVTMLFYSVFMKNVPWHIFRLYEVNWQTCVYMRLHAFTGDKLYQISL